MESPPGFLAPQRVAGVAAIREIRHAGGPLASGRVFVGVAEGPCQRQPTVARLKRGVPERCRTPRQWFRCGQGRPRLQAPAGASCAPTDVRWATSRHGRDTAPQPAFGNRSHAAWLGIDPQEVESLESRRSIPVPVMSVSPGKANMGIAGRGHAFRASRRIFSPGNARPVMAGADQNSRILAAQWFSGSVSDSLDQVP